MFLVLVGVPLAFAPFTSVQFLDIKLVLLAAGALLIAIARPDVDRRVAAAAAAFVAALALATAFSVDAWWSLLGPEDQGTGFVTLMIAAFLLCVGTGLGDSLRSRLPTWLFITGIVVSAVAVAGRFIEFGGASWTLGSLSSTIGHRVFVGGFAAAAAIAATAVRRRPWTWVGLLVIGSCLAVTAVRSAWVGAVLGFALVLWRGRNRRDVAMVLAPLLFAIVAWTVVDATASLSSLPHNDVAFSAAPRFADLDEGSARERPPVYRAYFRAFRNDPLLGSGPGTGWYGYMRHATSAELRVAGRGYSDAHNILFELAATTGIVGLLGFLTLTTVVVVRAVRAPPDRAWALGIAAVLAITHLLQPLNAVLTPLAFLCAGLACGTRVRPAARRTPRVVAVLMTIALTLVCVRMGSSAFQRYGSAYGSQGAFEWALRLEPRRLPATLLFAELRAFDHRTGDAVASRDTKRLTFSAVRQHGWSPRARPRAVNILLIMDDERGARALVRDHLRIFPGDPEALAAAALLELRRDDAVAAARFARQALAIDPEHVAARRTLRDATRKD